MADYRAFYVGSNGNFLKSVHLECMSDDTAIRKVRQLAKSNNIELWSGPRMVAMVDHRPTLRSIMLGLRGLTIA